MTTQVMGAGNGCLEPIGTPECSVNEFDQSGTRAMT